MPIVDVSIGNNVRITFPNLVNLFGCSIGDESMIGPFVEIQKGVTIGQKCKIQSHSFICSGVSIDDEVFIGHGVMFINDRFPKSTTQTGALKQERDWKLEQTFLERRVSIGSGSVILPGIRIGENAIVGAGSVVTKDVAPGSVVYGNPATFSRFLDL